MNLTHTQRLNLHVLLGAQRADVGQIRTIWALQDKLALSPEEEQTIELRREMLNGQEQMVWKPEATLPEKEIEFTEAEVTILRNTVLNWQGGFSASMDRKWLQPLLETFTLSVG